jgi:hypothetical protein
VPAHRRHHAVTAPQHSSPLYDVCDLAHHVRSCCENPAEMHERFPDVYGSMTPQVASFGC